MSWLAGILAPLLAYLALLFAPPLPRPAPRPAPVVAPRPAVAAPAPRPPTAAIPAPVDPCAVALAYLAANDAPGFATFCRPGERFRLNGVLSLSITCSGVALCPDHESEVVIYDPSCPSTYEDEAANTHWPFADWNAAGGTFITGGETFEGHTWDPYGNRC